MLLLYFAQHIGQVLGQEATRVVAPGGQETLAKRNVASVLGADHGRVRILPDLVKGQRSLGREHVVARVQKHRRHLDILYFGVETRVSVVLLVRRVVELLDREVDVKVAQRTALGYGLEVVALVRLEQVLVLEERLAQVARQVAVEREKVLGLFELFARVESVHGGADDQRVRDQAIVVALGQVAAELDSAQAHANSENLVLGVFLVNVLHDHVEVFVVGGAVGARTGEVDLDAAVVHDDGGAAGLDALLDQVRHVVLFGRAGESREHEEDDFFGRAQVGPVNGHLSTVGRLEDLAVVVVLDAALDDGEHDGVEHGGKAPDRGPIAGVHARELVGHAVHEGALFGDKLGPREADFDVPHEVEGDRDHGHVFAENRQNRDGVKGLVEGGDGTRVVEHEVEGVDELVEQGLGYDGD